MDEPQGDASNPEPQTNAERADASKAERRTALECPECFSHRAEVIHTIRGNRAMCLDCDHVYTIRFRHVQLPDERDDEQESQADPQPKKGKKRSMDEIRDDIVTVAPPDPRLLGTTTALLNDALAQGPAGIRRAQRAALRVASRFRVEIEDHWRRPTKWLDSKAKDDSDGCARACARFAMAWRPKFLAALSLTRSVILSCRAAHVAKPTVYAHRAADEGFAEQWQEAEADAIELLHARAFQRALEGDCEPIIYMGITVGWVRKYDSRLQIEMLRAHKPDTFKTAGVQVNIGQRNVMVLTEEQRHRLMDYNRQWLLDDSTRAVPVDTKPQVGVVEPQGVTHD